MHPDNPRVSIGLAVFNGADFVEQAIDSILAQTYSDFELIISDNASMDATEMICRGYAARDRRIRYSRNDANIGGANNENLTVAMSRGEYFRWAAHDDVVAPSFLAKAVEVLDRNPAVVLCSSMITEIDGNDDIIGTVSQKLGESNRPHERFGDLLRDDHNCEAIYGLIRADVLRKTKLPKNYTGSDRRFLCELSLHGQFFELPESLFFKRYHAKNAYVNIRSRMAWFDPKRRSKVVFPYWMQLFDYLSMLRRVPISSAEKTRCYALMSRWLFAHLRNLIGDIVLALLALLRRSRDPYQWRSRGRDIFNWE